MLNELILVPLIGIGLPVIVILIFLGIDKIAENEYEKRYGPLVASELNTYLRDANTVKIQQEYEIEIDKLKKEIGELEKQEEIHKSTINVLNNIIKECLNGAIKENEEIISDLEKLEEENKKIGEIK
jgi:hypothetical protein